MLSLFSSYSCFVRLSLVIASRASLSLSLSLSLSPPSAEAILALKRQPKTPLASQHMRVRSIARIFAEPLANALTMNALDVSALTSRSMASMRARSRSYARPSRVAHARAASRSTSKSDGARDARNEMEGDGKTQAKVSESNANERAREASVEWICVRDDRERRE